MPIMRLRIVVLLVALAAPAGAQDAPGWWMTEPIRFLQTNISERNSTLDPHRLVEKVADAGANTLLFNMGGIVAQYPTQVDFHYPSPYLPAGRDLFGEVLQAAHRRQMRVVGRFDLSKTQKPVYDAHPEWFFKRTNGQPAIYNGLYSVCINGDYYRRHAHTILSEALENYPVDGLFFNMFGNPRRDYSGNELGPCQCNACQTQFADQFGYALPTTPNDDYRKFMSASSRQVAASLAELIHRLRPQAAFLTYIQDHTDGIMSESNTSVTRPLPMWPYSASDNVNRARNSEPAKMSFNLCMSFVDFPWRYVTVPQPEIRLRLFQNLAHGAPPALVVVGTMDQEDRRSLEAARPIFQWHADHEDLYVGQQHDARVLLLSGSRESYRGFFRLLTEQHIPFAVSTNLRALADESRKFELVIAPDAAPPELLDFVRRGTSLLVSGAHPPPAPIATVVGRREATQGAWRIHDHAQFPSLSNTNLMFLNGPLVELQPLPKPLLTLIPPAMFGPPEKVWVDKVETEIPGLVLARHGQGQIAYFPWDVGRHYYRQSSEAHAGLLRDTIDSLLPGSRQLRTNAHPLVEITVMRQPGEQRTLVHLINLSGHSDTAYFNPIPMTDIHIDLAGDFSSVDAVKLGRPLPSTRREGRTLFTVPELNEYEVIILTEVKGLGSRVKGKASAPLSSAPSKLATRPSPFSLLLRPSALVPGPLTLSPQPSTLSP